MHISKRPPCVLVAVVLRVPLQYVSRRVMCAAEDLLCKACGTGLRPIHIKRVYRRGRFMYTTRRKAPFASPTAMASSPKPAPPAELPPKFECGSPGCPGTNFVLRRYLLNSPKVWWCDVIGVHVLQAG